MPNNFSYNLNIPFATNSPSVDQPNMLTNTNSISSLISVDHVGFNTNGSGIHKQVTLLNEAAPSLGDGNAVLFSNAVSGKSWPFWQNASTTMQLTGANVPSFTSFAVNIAYGTPPAGFTQQGGYTFLPGGLIFQYGFYGQAAALGASGTIQFPITFNNFFSVNASLNRIASGNSTITINTVSTSSFTFLSSTGGSDGIYWSAIGN